MGKKSKQTLNACPKCGAPPAPRADPLHAADGDLLRCPKCRFVYPASPDAARDSIRPTPAIDMEDTVIDGAGVHLGADEPLRSSGHLRLEVLSEPEGSQILSFTGNQVFFGREKAEIVLDDSKVSRRHAVIEFVGGSAFITDLGSTNGTNLNGARISRAELHVGDEICIGTTRFIIKTLNTG